MKKILVTLIIFTLLVMAGCSGGSDSDTGAAPVAAAQPQAPQAAEPEEPDFTGITTEEITDVAYVGFTTENSHVVYYYNRKGNVVKSDYTFSYNRPDVPGEEFLADYDSLKENISELYGAPGRDMDVMVMIALPEEIMNDKAALILGNYLRMGSRWDNPENVIVTGMYYDRDRQSVIITVKVEDRAYVEYFREREMQARETANAVDAAGDAGMTESAAE